MHPPHVKQAGVELLAQGLSDSEIGLRIGVPRRTVCDWRRRIQRCGSRDSARLCPRCWRGARAVRFDQPDYALLLGLYLGDGSISRHARTQRLRITLDERYPMIIAETRELLERGFPANRVHVSSRRRGRCADVSVYSCHLGCLLPQHGNGAKHERAIALEQWQQTVVDQWPWAFIKGCIWSDGCLFTNRTGAYEYPSFSFSNRSPDIARLFVAACDRVGVVTRATQDRRRGSWQVRINWRHSVALMLAHVGRKA